MSHTDSTVSATIDQLRLVIPQVVIHAVIQRTGKAQWFARKLDVTKQGELLAHYQHFLVGGKEQFPLINGQFDLAPFIC